MKDLTGPPKKLRKTTKMEGMSTSDDLNDIVNWSSDEDVFSGSSWNRDDVDYGDSVKITKKMRNRMLQCHKLKL